MPSATVGTPRGTRSARGRGPPVVVGELRWPVRGGGKQARGGGGGGVQWGGGVKVGPWVLTCCGVLTASRVPRLWRSSDRFLVGYRSLEDRRMPGKRSFEDRLVLGAGPFAVGVLPRSRSFEERFVLPVIVIVVVVVVVV